LAGRYVVGRVLGKGGFGITYLCYDTRENKTVAVKEYLPDHLTHRNTGETHVSTYSGETEEYFRTGAQKFFEEAKLVSNFNGNPNIISVYEFFYENNTTYFVMEYLDGVDLKTYIKQKGGKIPEGEALYIADKVIQALMIVHSTNILHRDISPDNIFICSDGKIKLIDFGAARQVMGEVSKSLSVVLKEGFAPIEQYQTRGKQGPWTDIYALGATLYYSLTGEVLDNAMTRMTDDSQMHLESVSPKLADIITKMLEIKKEDRYQNAFELSQAFSVFNKDVEEDDDGDDKEKVSVIEKIKTFTANIDAKTKKRILAVAGSIAAVIIAVIVAVVAIPDRSNVTESSGGNISGNNTPTLNGTIDVNQFTEEVKTTNKKEKTTKKKAEEDKTSATKKTSTTKKISTTKKKISATKQNNNVADWSTAEILKYYQDATAKVVSQKPGYTKTRTVVDKSHNADSVFPSTFRYQLFDSLGIGDENKFEETVRKGTNTCDSACGDYLKKSTLTTSDVTSAKAVKSGSNYVITIGIKSGSGKNTPIDKSCICVGDERVSVNFDRKTTLSIASVLGFSNYENTRNGKVVATVNASTGEISKLVIIWDSGLKMQQDADEFVMFTTVTYTNFGW
ncbi:MAG: serine/threonine protein kinase, partial [Clostridia bacterium]|nr:serine/threonine protein kinase [Clostridia bacterium]